MIRTKQNSGKATVKTVAVTIDIPVDAMKQLRCWALAHSSTVEADILEIVLDGAGHGVPDPDQINADGFIHPAATVEAAGKAKADPWRALGDRLPLSVGEGLLAAVEFFIMGDKVQAAGEASDDGIDADPAFELAAVLWRKAGDAAFTALPVMQPTEKSI